MVNYWCINLYLRSFRQSWKRHCSLSFLILYQTGVVLSVCGCWLLQNLEKRKKSIKLNRLQIEVFFLPNISPSPSNIGPSNLSFARIYARTYYRDFTILQYLFPCNIVIYQRPRWLWRGMSRPETDNKEVFSDKFVGNISKYQVKQRQHKDLVINSLTKLKKQKLRLVHKERSRHSPIVKK